MIPSGIVVVGSIYEAPRFNDLCHKSLHWVSKFRTLNPNLTTNPAKGGTRHHRPRLQYIPDSAILGPPLS